MTRRVRWPVSAPTPCQHCSRKCGDITRVISSADVWALQKIGPTAQAAVPELVEMLADRPADGRESLGQVTTGEDPAVAEALRRQAAIYALEAIGPKCGAGGPRVGVPAKGREGRRRYALHALAKIGKPAVPTLVADLPDTIDLLGSMGPQATDALPGLKALLDAKNGNSIRFSAADAIASIGGDTEAILPVIREMYGSETPQVRTQAFKLMYIVALKDRTNWVVATLRKGLSDPDRAVRFASAGALLANFRATAHETLPVLGEMLIYKDVGGSDQGEAAKAIIMLLGHRNDSEEWPDPRL